MKKFLSMVLAGIVAVGLAGCGSNTKKDGKKVVEINVAVSPDYAPYESKDKDGNIIGFDADMVKLFPSYLNTDTTTYKFKWNSMSFDNIVTQVQAGQVDLGISGFTYDEKRQVEWSKPYTASAQVAVVNKDSNIKTVKDLEGKKLLAQSGATGEAAAKAVKNANVTTVKNVQQIFSALTAKQYDAVIVDLAVANNYAKAQGFKVLSESLLDEKNYIIAKKGNKEMIDLVNKALEKFLASNDYKKLTDKYGLKKLEK